MQDSIRITEHRDNSLPTAPIKVDACPSCGEILSIHQELSNTIIRVDENNHVSTIPPKLSTTVFCGNPHCSSKQPIKHDGELDGPNGCSVSHSAVWTDTPRKGPSIYVQGIQISDERKEVYLTATQALSLLDWLQQEKETLEQMVKEQANG